MKQMERKRNQPKITAKKLNNDSVFYLLVKGRSRKWINFQAMDTAMLQLVMLYEKEVQEQADKDKKQKHEQQHKQKEKDDEKNEMEEPQTKEHHQEDKQTYEPYQIKINEIRKAAKQQSTNSASLTPKKTSQPQSSSPSAYIHTNTSNDCNQPLKHPRIKNMLFLNQLQGELFFKVYFQDGHEDIINNKRMRVAFPQQLISFYENNIQISNNIGDHHTTNKTIKEQTNQ